MRVLGVTPLCVCWLAACAAPPPSGGGDACADLLAAPPHEWSARLAAIHPLGSAASPRLLGLLRARPDAPGAPAAVCLLGRFGGEGVLHWLRELLRDRSPLAVEAALALGELRAVDTADDLADCMNDATADATVRTAAACALTRCGRGRAAAPFLHAVLLAGSPAGVATGRAHGLPERPRWALERYMVQRLLAQTGANDLALALDPDASWPDLAAVSERIRRWLEAR